jgi:putative redox protein
VGQRPENAVPALFNTITVKVLLEGDFSADKAKRAVALSFDKYCSVSKTLEHTATINYEIYLNGEKV